MRSRKPGGSFGMLHAPHLVLSLLSQLWYDFFSLILSNVSDINYAFRQDFFSRLMKNSPRRAPSLKFTTRRISTPTSIFSSRRQTISTSRIYLNSTTVSFSPRARYEQMKNRLTMVTAAILKTQ
jgi:hypothetical protein